MAVNSSARAFTAPSLEGLWRYWNPGFGYFLLRYCYGPLRRVGSPSWSLVLTFAICGLFHDALWMPAIMVRDARIPFPFVTGWFAIIGCGILVAGRAGRRLGALSPGFRVLTHGAFLVATFCLTLWAKTLFG